LFKLERELVDEAFESIPEALVNLKLVEERLREEDLSILDLNCYICYEKNHVASRCPSVIIISDQNQLKRHWMEQRRNHTKLIGIIEETPRRRQMRNYNIRNVQGSPTREPFKDLGLLRKTQKFIKDHASWERSQVRQKAIPELSMLFDQDSEDEQFEEQIASFGQPTTHRSKMSFK
jgi:hypothetical protein